MIRKSNIIKFIRILVSISIVLGLFSSCLQAPRTSKKSRSSSSSTGGSTGDATNSTETPTFSNDLNYLQNGAVTSSNIFSIPSDLTAGFYLRGKQVDQFIRNGNESNIICLTAYFSTSPSKQILTLAATPKNFYNFSTRTQEYYYLLDPSGKTSNQTFCQKSGLINQMSVNYPSQVMAYSLTDLCSNCSLTALTSQPMALFSPSGGFIDQIDTSYIRINLNKATGSNSTVNYCSSSSDCQAKGYDCCSEGICVNDKQLKDGVDQTSSGFLQAQQDILLNASAIFSYPEYYHLCSSVVQPAPTPTPVPNPQDEAMKRFIKLQELYNCANPSEGEMSLCTKTFSNATSDSVNGVAYYTGADDRNFTSTYSGTAGLQQHSINKVEYGGEILFSNGTYDNTKLKIGPSGSETGNDNLSDTQLVTLYHTLSSSAEGSDLKITYQIDGSCEKISSSLAKCYKVYTQGQNLKKITDHYPASNEFLLPPYADINKTVKAEVDNTAKLIGTHWQLQKTSPAKVIFNGPDLQVYDTQEVKLTFFVDLNSNNVTQSHEDALVDIKNICNCADTTCNLKPKLDLNNVVIDYICDYPDNNTTPPPLYQEVLLDSKSVPHPYFDESGVLQTDVTSTTPAQEGTKFEYAGNNLLKPNNTSQYVGFNEIYGSFGQDPTSARPAQVVRVEKGKTYDLYVDSGTFSTCFYCGTDYYSNVAKIFPQNFLHRGGGYQPDETVSSKFDTRDYRADDLIFGRACWAPVTMIPWTHRPTSDRQQQRLSRLRAQHFMFSNGYQRDWYGFDYGSVIGSFDGVTWFSVGNQRRIKANTSKLFLALNAYFGDQTLSTTFKITVSDASTVPASGSTVLSDFDSDGAQCQKYHVCNTDSDCISNLGWDYTCESITGLSTKWPTFDNNGLEIPGQETTISLLSLFNASKGGAKRCVYRGRGTPCYTDPDIADSNSTYSGTSKMSFHACSQNTYCQQFISGVTQSKFNRKIVRYGKSVKYQNASLDVDQSDADEFGLGTRILGRPFDWIGSESIDGETQANLTHNQVTGMCIPGRDPAPTNLLISESNKNAPDPEYNGDQVNGIGMTMKGTGPNQHYLSSCQVLDSTGNSFFLDTANLPKALNDTAIVPLAATQSLSTNALDILESLSGNDFVKQFESSFIQEPTLQQNRCLRAPGSICLTDMECGPSSFVQEKIANIDPDSIPDLNLDGISDLTKYEVKFWQEKLVCSQAKAPGEDGFALNKNKCCRLSGNKVTIGTAFKIKNGAGVQAAPGKPDFDVISIPGIDIGLDDRTRNSRNSTVHDLVKDGTNSDYPPLMTANEDSCPAAATCITKDTELKITNQWRTFAATAERTCCSGNWVRNYHKDNGGGHLWEAAKTQIIPKESFACYNWDVCTNCSAGVAAAGLSCAAVGGDSPTDKPDDPGCPARSVPSAEARNIFNWMNSLELLGIPQVTVPSKTNSQILCRVNPDNAADTNPITVPAPNIFSSTGVADYSAGEFAGHDKTNFDGSLKMIFSEDEVACCLPAGTEVAAGSDPSMCCTGFINPDNNKCQLKDFTNISVFFNRYVSSMAKDLPANQIDPATGFVKDPTTVMRMACQMDVCASKVVAFGVSLSDLKVRGHENNDYQTRRFIDAKDDANNFSGLVDLWESGLKWNEDVYCVPSDIDLDIAYDCGAF